jgi:PKD repeat protein
MAFTMKRSIVFISIVFSSLWTLAQQNWCGTDLIQQRLKETHPEYALTLHKGMSKAASGSSAGNKAILYIPVVVHIIHDNGIGNISEEQVYDALRVLNEDYNRLNSDTSETRNTAGAPFRSIAGDMKVQFKLAKIDPNGNCTNGIVRVNAPELTYNADDACKYSSNGGSDQWPMDRYLNIWVVNSISNDGPGMILGYAYLPYWPNGENYGILIRNDTFGTIGTAAFSDGRTMTHEMGHLLGLQHIFDEGPSGACHDTDCSSNGDYCCDTPPQAEANWSCSMVWNSCSLIPQNDDFGFDALDQIENYMSYNACQNMFSMDQVSIMQNNFIDIDFLANMVTAANVTSTGINQSDVFCKAEFDAFKRQICAGETVPFYDYSFNAPNAWTWNISPGSEGTDWMFVNGTTAGSQNPEVQFLTQGFYSISLTASDGVNSDTEVKTNMIAVFPSYFSVPFWEGFENYTTFNNNPNWVVVNPGENNKFSVFDGAGSSGERSARLVNYGQGGNNWDELISAPIDLSVVDPDTENVTLSFRYAYRKRISSNDEWLKVFISADCGDNWVQRKTLHGNQLSSQTFPSSWIPELSDWVTVHMINVTSGYFSENFRMRFRFEGENGNNFYLDDINLYKGDPSDILILGLTEIQDIADFSVYPNPTEGDVEISFAVAEVGITVLEVLDLAGKTVKKEIIQAAQGTNLVLMETNALAKGIYNIRLSNGSSAQMKPLVVR